MARRFTKHARQNTNAYSEKNTMKKEPNGIALVGCQHHLLALVLARTAVADAHPVAAAERHRGLLNAVP